MSIIKRLEAYECNVCKGNVINKANSDRYNVGGKAIIFTYTQCTKCNMKYGFAFDDELTKELKEKIKRYIDMKIDKDLIKDFRTEHTNAMSMNEELLKSCDKYINDDLIYYNYSRKQNKK